MDSEQSRQLAKDENTAPDKLRELADSSDSITRQNVVMNPNVPPDVLIKLAEQFPRQVFNNPAIDLLLLETPNLFSGTSADALCSLLKREVPERAIEYAVNSADERLKLAILMNPQTSSEILEQLAKSKNYQIAESAALHINFINNNSADNYQEFIRSKIQLEKTNANKRYSVILGEIDNLIRLYAHIPRCISYYMRWSINHRKNHPKIALNEVEKMIESKKPMLNVARNPNISIEIIRKLLERPDRYEIGRAIAANPSTPVEILAELAESNRHNAVHRTVASNPKTPNSVLEILLNKPRLMDYVWEALGRNQNMSVDSLSKLVSKSKNALVPIFNNPQAPEDLKFKLLEYFQEKNIIPISQYYPQNFINNAYVSGDFLDKCIDLRIGSIQNIKNLKYKRSQLIKQNYSTSLKIFAFHPNLNSNSLKELLDYEDKGVRSSAIANYKTPQYITEVLGMSFLENLNQNELKSLASNFFATEELLKELVNHKDIVVSRTAASNPCASDEILEEWQTSPYYKEGVLEQIMAEEQRLLDRWKSSISSANRLTVLLNSEAPIEVLAKISRSTSWLERYAITQNPKTPYPIVQRLAEDSNLIVRAAAKASLKKYQKKVIN